MYLCKALMLGKKVVQKGMPASLSLSLPPPRGLAGGGVTGGGVASGGGRGMPASLSLSLPTPRWLGISRRDCVAGD